MADKSNRRNIQNKRLILFIKQKHLEFANRQGKSQQRNRLHRVCLRTHQLWNISYPIMPSSRFLSCGTVIPISKEAHSTVLGIMRTDH